MKREEQRPKRIGLLGPSLLPYRWLPTPIPVTIELTHDFRLTHADALVWPPVEGLMVGERVFPPEAWQLERLEGPDPADPGHWALMSRDGLEFDHGPGRGMLSNGMVINIPAGTLIFGGMRR